jgi:integrase
MPVDDELVEVVGLGRVERLECEVVEDEEVDAGELAELGLERVVQHELGHDAVHTLDLPRQNATKDSEINALADSEARFLTHDQLADLADAAGDYRTLVLTLGYCGLRWGEAAGLRVGHVDCLRGRMQVVESVAEVNGRIVFGSPKSHQHRSVPVPRFLRDELMAATAGKSPGDLVFASPTGTVLRLSNFRNRVFDGAARAAALDGLTPHELRHTSASLAIAAGASIKGVQRMLGHKSATLTLDRYGHLFGDELDLVAERLDVHRADFLRTRGGPGTVSDLAANRQ